MNRSMKRGSGTIRGRKAHSQLWTRTISAAVCAAVLLAAPALAATDADGRTVWKAGYTYGEERGGEKKAVSETAYGQTDTGVEPACRDGWFLDTEGCLHLTGEDLNWNDNELPPWNSHSMEIVRAVAEPGCCLRTCSNLFSGCVNLTDVDLDAAVTDAQTISASAMFMGCGSLISLDLSGLDMANLVYADHMFENCEQLETLILPADFGAGSGDDDVVSAAHSVRSAREMFKNCKKLKTVDVHSMNMRDCSCAIGMFEGCISLKTVQLTGGDFSFSGTEPFSIERMFADCCRLTTVDLSEMLPEGNHCVSMDAMFMNCRGLTDVNVSGIDTSHVESMWALFNGCVSLKSPQPEVSEWNTTRVRDMGSIFDGDCNLYDLDLSGWDCGMVGSGRSEEETGRSYLNGLFAWFGLDKGIEYYPRLAIPASLLQNRAHFAGDELGNTGLFDYYPMKQWATARGEDQLLFCSDDDLYQVSLNADVPEIIIINPVRFSLTYLVEGDPMYGLPSDSYRMEAYADGTESGYRIEDKGSIGYVYDFAAKAYVYDNAALFGNRDADATGCSAEGTFYMTDDPASAGGYLPGRTVTLADIPTTAWASADGTDESIQGVWTFVPLDQDGNEVEGTGWGLEQNASVKGGVAQGFIMLPERIEAAGDQYLVLRGRWRFAPETRIPADQAHSGEDDERLPKS